MPLSVRYDPHEKVHGEPFPHLFARRIGTRQEVFSPRSVRGSAQRDRRRPACATPDGRSRFTPHDFRRLFTTELVSTGLPLHIAATLLGHLSLDTTRGYTAVFPEEVIAAHQAVHRTPPTRSAQTARLRPPTARSGPSSKSTSCSARSPSASCHRPYGTPCVHEHACTRCRFLRVDPAQLGRIEEMTANAEARLVEAKDRAWLGEVAALEESPASTCAAAGPRSKPNQPDQPPRAPPGDTPPPVGQAGQRHPADHPVDFRLADVLIGTWQARFQDQVQLRSVRHEVHVIKREVEDLLRRIIAAMWLKLGAA